MSDAVLPPPSLLLVVFSSTAAQGNWRSLQALLQLPSLRHPLILRRLLLACLTSECKQRDII